MKPKTPNQKSKYAALNKRLAAYLLVVGTIFEETEREAENMAATVGYDGKQPFRFSDYTQLKERKENNFNGWDMLLLAFLLSRMKDEWQRSNKVQDELTDKALKTYGIEDRPQKYLQTNLDALKLFQDRSDGELSIERKIERLKEEYQRVLEAAISVSRRTGTPASAYIADVKRLRREYKEQFGTDPGIYDVTFQTMRLVRSEINMAYRRAEQLRWQQMDFIVGYEIKLHKTHEERMPHGDICDALAGRYPKDFLWTGWHPNDMCYAVPIVKTFEQYWSGEEVTIPMPDAVGRWLEENDERLQSASQRGTLPYWVRETVEQLIEKYKGLSAKKKKTPALTMIDATGGIASTVLKGITSLINSLYRLQSNRECVAVLRQIISHKSFEKMNYHSTKDNSIFAIGMKSFDRVLKEGEMPNNLIIAKKMLGHGYDVYILPNPNSTVSADFILLKKGKLYYTEAKTLNGKNSLDNRLKGGAVQSGRVIVDVIGTNDAKYISSTLKTSFEDNDKLREVILLKGGRMIKVSRNDIDKRFKKKFERIWSREK